MKRILMTRILMTRIRMSRTLQAACAAIGLVLLSSLPAISFEFFGFTPASRQPPASARTHIPRPPAQLDITGSINVSGAEVADTARIIAGMAPAAGSPLASLTGDESWKQHARFFDRAFGELDRTQLA